MWRFESWIFQIWPSCNGGGETRLGGGETRLVRIMLFRHSTYQSIQFGPQESGSAPFSSAVTNPPGVDSVGKHWENRNVFQNLEKMVGAVRFELTTSCTPSKRAYQATLRPDRSFIRLAPNETRIVGGQRLNSITYLLDSAKDECPTRSKSVRLQLCPRRPRD